MPSSLAPFAAAFEQLCRPVAPSCQVEDDQANRGRKGLGNALFAYAASAAEAFEKKCSISFVDEGEEADEDAEAERRGSSNVFRLDQHCVSPPPRIATRNIGRHGLQPSPCTLYPLTQPLSGSLVAKRLAKVWKGTEAGAPVVGLHLRTGWSDTIALHDEWAKLRCAHVASLPEYEPSAASMWVAGHVPEFGAKHHVDLGEILDRTASAADAAFGARKWKLFVASDSATVKQRVAERVGKRALAIRWVEGRIGHNNNAAEGDASEALDIGASTVADFVALRDSDMLLGYLSNFPKRAGQGAVCPQRWFEMRSRERKDDAREHVIDMDARLRGLMETDGDIPVPVRPLAEHMPPGHPCLRSANPLRDCACFYRIALGKRTSPKGGEGGATRGKKRQKKRRRRRIKRKRRRRRKKQREEEKEDDE